MCSAIETLCYVFHGSLVTLNDELLEFLSHLLIDLWAHDFLGQVYLTVKLLVLYVTYLIPSFQAHSLSV